MRESTNSNFITIIILIIAVGGFMFVLYRNAEPTKSLIAIIPTQILEPTSDSSLLQDIFKPGFGEDTTLPTIAIPTQPYAAPTLIQNTSPTPTFVAASELGNNDLFTLAPISAGVTPTLPSSPIPTQNEQVTVQAQPVQQGATLVWNPPALIPPINRDPLGRDHYYFDRPVDPNAQNFGIAYYSYGSDGFQLSNPSRIHHGIDMPNDIGTTIRATESGIVVFSPTEENPFFQNTSSYGNVVAIEHDIGWNNQIIWTVYAHLEKSLVAIGDRVSMNDPIGLIGNTGRSSGPHVHFEVRVGASPPLLYGSTFNPILWMVPYVGHGTIAGRVVSSRDNLLDDMELTLRNWSTGIFEATTTSYIYLDSVNDVNSDPNWNENFVFGDVPVGRYEVITHYEGQRLSQIIDVFEGQTSFVELKAEPLPTQEPTEEDDGGG